MGVGFSGNEYPFLSWMSQLGLSTEGGPDGVTVLKQGFNVDPLLQKQAACISTMTYNEYWQVIDAREDTPSCLTNSAKGLIATVNSRDSLNGLGNRRSRKRG